MNSEKDVINEELLRKELPKVVAGANFGVWVDFYDFFLSSFVAGLVWPRIFFSKTLPPALALAYSLISFATVYFMRPIGAYIFGHLGDRIGRRDALVWTLIMMAIGVLGIGILPPYATIGAAAPILLGVFRALQGLAIGGEYGPSYTWVAEFATRSKLRTFWVGLSQTIILIGKSTSSAVTSIMLFLMPLSAFIAYGWRIPYLLGATVGLIGIIIRLRLLESPLFKLLMEKQEVEKYPASQALKKYWGRILGLACIPLLTVGLGAWIQAPYSVTYMQALGVKASYATLSVTIGTAAAIPICLLGSYLGTRIRKRTILVVGSALTAAILFPFFWLIQTLNLYFIALAQIIFEWTTYFGSSVQGPLLTEQFPTKVRSSGVGLATGFTSIYTGIATGAFLPLILRATGSITAAWPIVAAVGVAMSLLTLLNTVFVAKEPEKFTPLENIK